jgi:hypothetical protein
MAGASSISRESPLLNLPALPQRERIFSDLYDIPTESHRHNFHLLSHIQLALLKPVLYPTTESLIFLLSLRDPLLDSAILRPTDCLVLNAPTEEG